MTTESEAEYPIIRIGSIGRVSKGKNISHARERATPRIIQSWRARGTRRGLDRRIRGREEERKNGEGREKEGRRKGKRERERAETLDIPAALENKESVGARLSSYRAVGGKPFRYRMKTKGRAAGAEVEGESLLTFR